MRRRPSTAESLAVHSGVAVIVVAVALTDGDLYRHRLHQDRPGQVRLVRTLPASAVCSWSFAVGHMDLWWIGAHDHQLSGPRRRGAGSDENGRNIAGTDHVSLNRSTGWQGGLTHPVRTRPQSESVGPWFYPGPNTCRVDARQLG